MELTFLTPFAALFGVVALVPLLVWRARERRLAHVRSALRLKEPSRRGRFAIASALAGVCALLALAAAQPVVATTRELPERTDAQVFVVLDTSRSMHASAEPGAPSRFERARSIAVSLRDALPEVPMGIASMTSGVLPHLFPTTDRRVFVATSKDSIDIERPPPSFSATLATAIEGIADVPVKNYFPPSAKKRVLVVLSDGESRPLENAAEFDAAFDKKPGIETIFVRLWYEDERIYLTRVAEVGYEPDPTSDEQLEDIADLIDARVIAESEARELPDLVAKAVGTGPTIAREHEGRRRALMPWITLAAIFPLGFVLVRRNL
jgi:von Willebrand factor type A domain